MSRIAIVTDSNSGITQEEAKQMGVFVLPMPFLIDEQEYFEDITLTQDEFYEKLTTNPNFPTTSQPSPAMFLDYFKEAKKNDFSNNKCLEKELSFQGSGAILHQLFFENMGPAVPTSPSVELM